MSDSDEDYPSPTAQMSGYPTYEIDCNLETLMAIKPPLSVLLHPPEYTDAQLIIDSNESPLKSMKTDPTPSNKDIPFDIYSRPQDEDDMEGSLATDDLGNVSVITGESETFAEYGDYSEDNVSDNSLDDLLDAATDFRESFVGQRLPDILDNLTGVQDDSMCLCTDDYLTVKAEKIVICSPDEKQNRLTSDNQIICGKGERGEDEEEDEDDCADSKFDSQNELTFGEYTFSELDFQSRDLLGKELKMKYPMRSSVSNIPQGTGHLELTKEERQLMIDEMLLLRKDTIKGNRRHSWTGNLKLGKSPFFLSSYRPY